MEKLFTRNILNLSMMRISFINIYGFINCASSPSCWETTDFWIHRDCWPQFIEIVGEWDFEEFPFTMLRLWKISIRNISSIWNHNDLWYHIQVLWFYYSFSIVINWFFQIISYTVVCLHNNICFIFFFFDTTFNLNLIHEQISYLTWMKFWNSKRC